MSIHINHFQATQLLSLFGGDDADIVISEMDGHSGPGLYAWFSDYPDEGVAFLDKSANAESKSADLD